MTGVQLGGEGSKYVRVPFDVWYQESDRSIHITAPGLGNFHTTVNDKPESKRSHPHLYKSLKQLLQQHGRWPDVPEINESK
jgi:hypothetical protein